MTIQPNPIIQDLLTFLDDSPTAWHATQTISQRLFDNGFIELNEGAKWQLEQGKRYVVTRNGSSLCAFYMPKTKPTSVRILASHTDSPALKLKPNPEFRKQNMILFGAEIYGAPLLTSWLNRDLGLAGRVVYFDENNQLKESLVQLDRHPFVIPQLAIHLDRDVNEKGLLLNKQDHLSVLAAIDDGTLPTPYFEAILKENLAFRQILGFELFFYPLQRAQLIGYQQQMISSYRIDSLGSVHAALTAFLQVQEDKEDYVKMIAFWDNEEIGSSTAQGAGSPFLPETIERLMLAVQGTREDYLRLLRRSLCISIDLAHALHPNYTEKHDPQHLPLMGKGVILKTNAQQRYASDSRLFALINLVAKEAGAAVQTYVNRNDMGAGSTIGPIQSTLTGIPTIDIGCGQLSMHSSRELTACQDHLTLLELLTAILNHQLYLPLSL